MLRSLYQPSGLILKNHSWFEIFIIVLRALSLFSASTSLNLASWLLIVEIETIEPGGRQKLWRFSFTREAEEYYFVACLSRALAGDFIRGHANFRLIRLGK
jgi:hypothetical protein